MVRAKKKSKNAKTTFEICPYCDNEVEIPADLSNCILAPYVESRLQPARFAINCRIAKGV